MNCTTNNSLNSAEFQCKDLVFAKVRGHKPWPAQIESMDKTHKNMTKYKVSFFETNQTAIVNKNDICLYNINRDKYPPEAIALRYRHMYKTALAKIETAWEAARLQDEVSSPGVAKHFKTPSPKQSEIKSLQCSTPLNFNCTDQLNVKENSLHKDKPNTRDASVNTHIISATLSSEDLPLPQDSSDLAMENSALKKELSELKVHMKTILDHSIETDQRLMQFTSEIFSATPLKTNSPDQTTPTENENMRTEKLQKDLRSALLTINEKESIINKLNLPCERCTVFEEELQNMIDAIRSLEATNKILEAQLTKQHTPLLEQTNKFGPLDNLKEDENSFTTVSYKKLRQNKETSQSKKKKKRKIYRQTKSQVQSKKIDLTRNVHFNNVSIIGDSHARHLAALIAELTARNVVISGVCKPGAGLRDIAPTSTPPPNHCYVLMAGANDVDAGRQSIIFDHYEAIFRNCRRHSKVLVCPLPPRHDLPSGSPIHGVVRQANLHIAEVCSRIEGVELFDTSGMERHLFTAHGLHLRLRGKRQLARMIADKLVDMSPKPFQHTSPNSPNQKSSLSPEKDLQPTPLSPPTTDSTPQKPMPCLPCSSYSEALTSPQPGTSSNPSATNMPKTLQHYSAFTCKNPLAFRSDFLGSLPPVTKQN